MRRKTGARLTRYLTALSLSVSWIGMCPHVRAEVRLPALLSDHMLLQRGRPIHLWGDASPAETVTVSFRSSDTSTTADRYGHWSLYLPPQEAGGPFDMTIRGKNVISLTDVMVGDVWLASGQSNMAFAMHGLTDSAAQIAHAENPNIRLLHVNQKASPYPLRRVEATPWSRCSPDSVSNFSAVGYFFARDIQKSENVPIGVIESDWGGTPAEAWTSLGALAAEPELMPVFAANARMSDDWEHVLDVERDEERTELDAEKAGKPKSPPLWHPDLSSNSPAELYNGMIAPITPFPIRGVIWYQGETNTDGTRAPLYGSLLRTLIADWRSRWGEDDMPFLIVQLTNFADLPVQDWPAIREAQRSALQLRNTGMAVTIGLGESHNIHPKNKAAVGARLALAARAIAYGESLEFSGPVLRQVTAEAGSLRLWFDHAEGGLRAKQQHPDGFEIAGADKHFVPAAATLDGVCVLLTSRDIATPVYVRYAWTNDAQPTLFNRADLPASPFRSRIGGTE